jgi:hypothetical protein
MDRQSSRLIKVIDVSEHFRILDGLAAEGNDYNRPNRPEMATAHKIDVVPGSLPDMRDDRRLYDLISSELGIVSARPSHAQQQESVIRHSLY